MKTRQTNLNELPVSAAVKKLNPHLFEGRTGPACSENGILGMSNAEIAKTAKPRLRQDRKGPNKLEAEFEAWLREEWSDTPHELLVQGITLLLSNGNRYTPDFLLVVPRDTGKPYFQMLAFETKGFMRDDAAVKVKTAARLFPWIKFHLVTKKRKKDGGGWAIEEVLP